MPQQSPNSTPVLYTVCYKPYDGSVQNDAMLTAVRRSYLTTLKHAAGKTHSIAAGADISIHYKIDREKFSWRKVSGKIILQEAYREKDGYYILTRNLAGETVSKAHYSGNHFWLQTAYYSGNTARPAALLKPNQRGSGLVLLQFVLQTGKYTQSELELCPISMGTAEQSLINTVAGEPQIIVETDCGSFCCCSASEKKSRMAVLNDLRSGEKNLMPDWPKEESTAFDFIYIENDGSTPEPEPEKPMVQAPQEPDYAANLEIFSTDEPVQELVSEPEPISEPMIRPVNEPENENTSVREPVRYSVAVKGLDGQAQISDFIPPHVERCTKRIVISAEESYTYFGKVIDGLRQGRGRTQMQNGRTAYEGDYCNDKRDGFGTYYYKSGKICYVGDWKGNKRDGVGIAYSSHDGSIFVGRWKDNIPTGSGAAFDVNGSLIYTGEWENGLRHGHGTEYKNGEVIFSGEFREDKYYSGYKHI